MVVCWTVSQVRQMCIIQSRSPHYQPMSAEKERIRVKSAKLACPYKSRMKSALLVHINNSMASNKCSFYVGATIISILIAASQQQPIPTTTHSPVLSVNSLLDEIMDSGPTNTRNQGTTTTTVVTATLGCT